ncbi:unnamed protein product [Spodoptera exigua]|nr:unnamed protein product [Spodoptera exigua]
MTPFSLRANTARVCAAYLHGAVHVCDTCACVMSHEMERAFRDACACVATERSVNQTWMQALYSDIAVRRTLGRAARPCLPTDALSARPAQTSAGFREGWRCRLRESKFQWLACALDVKSSSSSTNKDYTLFAIFNSRNIPPASNSHRSNKKKINYSKFKSNRVGKVSRIRARVIERRRSVGMQLQGRDAPALAK